MQGLNIFGKRMSWIEETSTEALGWEPGGCSRTSKKAGMEQSVGKE